MLGEARARIELAHPDGHTVTSGEADLVLTEERLEVTLPSIHPLVFPLVSIVEMDLLSGTIPLVLDSGYVARLSDFADPDSLFAALSERRRRELTRYLLRPSRARIAEFEADVMWSESGWEPLEDVASVIVDQTHTTIVPSRYGAFAFPHASVTRVESTEGRFRIEESRLALEAAVRAADRRPLRDAVWAIRRAIAFCESALSERLGLERLEPPVSRATIERMESGAWDRVMAATCSEGCAGAVSLLAGLAAPEETHVAWAPYPPNPALDELELAVWCLAVHRRRGRVPFLVAICMIAPEPDAFVFTARPPGPASEGDDDTTDALATLADAIGLMAPDAGPLALPESELSTVYGGAWLWPMHHLEPLAHARRALVGRVAPGDPDRWGHELLELLGRGD
jgi:hypothetical protein